MNELLGFIEAERDPIFAALLFIGIYAVYRIYHYEMRRKDRKKKEDPSHSNDS